MKYIVRIFGFKLLITQLFAIAGFGISANQSLFNVVENTNPLLLIQNTSQIEVGNITQNSFQNGLGIGGYLYIDALPFIDLDLECNLNWSEYDFSFNNTLYNINKKFMWSSISGYITLNKKIIQIKIPFIAKAKLSTGAGINTHSYTPMINQNMLEATIEGGDIENGELNYDKLVNYLIDNKISLNGFHIQTGLQFKILFIDSFLYYRYSIADGIIPGNKAFSSLNLRLGMAI